MTQTTNILGTEKGNEGRVHYNPIDIAKEVEERLIDEKRHEQLAKKLQEEKDKLNPAPKVVPEIINPAPFLDTNNNTSPIKPLYVHSKYQSIEDVVSDIFDCDIKFLWRKNKVTENVATNYIYITTFPIALKRNFIDTREFLKNTPFFLPSVDLLLEHLENLRLAAKNECTLTLVDSRDWCDYKQTDAQNSYSRYLNSRSPHAYPFKSWLNDIGILANRGINYQIAQDINISSHEYMNDGLSSKIALVQSNELPSFSKMPYDQESWRTYRSNKSRSLRMIANSYLHNGARIQKVGFSSCTFNFRFSPSRGKVEIETLELDDSIHSDSFLCITNEDYLKLKADYEQKNGKI